MTNEFRITIAEASKQIEGICKTYFEKNEDGSYCIPVNRQRPIVLIGPAGIGKTDIPKQVAEKMRIGFISYSITHHTRQSLIGLPKIVEKQYFDESVLTTEYTASEIIASVYEEIEKNGKDRGILFIDEVNCVSETLAAPLLQLFQNKMFGQRKIPDGWVLVMAGNPPEYNKSVKAFDAVTKDRLRIINVKPDADTWLEYANNRSLNSYVISYISSVKDSLYVFDENNGDIVTPRAWEELSINIDAYLRNDLDITADFVAQFIGVANIVIDFINYYKLMKDYIDESLINNIFEGNIDNKSLMKMTKADNRVRYYLISILKKKLRVSAIEDGVEKTSERLNNIVEFINMAYGNGNELEFFMSNVVTDSEIVKALTRTNNAHYIKHLKYITGTRKDILKELREMN